MSWQPVIMKWSKHSSMSWECLSCNAPGLCCLYRFYHRIICSCKLIWQFHWAKLHVPTCGVSFTTTVWANQTFACAKVHQVLKWPFASSITCIHSSCMHRWRSYSCACIFGHAQRSLLLKVGLHKPVPGTLRSKHIDWPHNQEDKLTDWHKDNYCLTVVLCAYPTEMAQYWYGSDYPLGWIKSLCIFRSPRRFWRDWILLELQSNASLKNLIPECSLNFTWEGLPPWKAVTSLSSTETTPYPTTNGRVTLARITQLLSLLIFTLLPVIWNMIQVTFFLWLLADENSKVRGMGGGKGKLEEEKMEEADEDIKQRVANSTDENLIIISLDKITELSPTLQTKPQPAHCIF